MSVLILFSLKLFSLYNNIFPFFLANTMENFKLLLISMSLIFAINANDNLQSYCGSMLINELKTVCKSDYYGANKRSPYLGM